MKKQQTIYDLKLHESIDNPCEGFQRVTRVPGGWLYMKHARIEDSHGSVFQLEFNTVFVPLNYEFAPDFR